MPKVLSTTKTCSNCDKTFHTDRDDQTYCSARCRRSAARKRATAAPGPKASAKTSAPNADGKISLRDVRLNPSLNPLLATWNQLDDCAKRIIEYAEKHLGPEAIAKAALGQEKINDGFLLLDEVAESIR